MPRLHFICRRDFPSYYPCQLIALWNKRRFMCLLLLSTDLSISVDVERNPGPGCSLLNNTTHSTTSSYNVCGPDQGHQKHYQFSCISYKRNQLLFLGHRSKHFSCSPAFLWKLKAMDLLGYREKLAGRLTKQKSTGNGLRIPVICSGHRHYSVSLNVQNATSVLQNFESHLLGVNVNDLICICLDPSRPTV